MRDQLSLQRDRALFQSEVAKLVLNQQEFEVRVREMNTLFALVKSEQEKVNRKKRALKDIILQDGLLQRTQKEVADLKQQLASMRTQAKIMVESLVRDIVKRKYNVGDYPLQTNQGYQHHTPSSEEQRLIKQRIKELDQREAELNAREAELYGRELQVEADYEELARQQELIRDQHFEIGQETKKLKIFTLRYEEMLEKEIQIQQIAQQITQREEKLDNKALDIDTKLKFIEKERQDFRMDKLNASKIERRIQHIQVQSQMEIEDIRSLCEREVTGASFMALEAQELKIQYESQHRIVMSNLEVQKQRLNELIDEKLEQVSIVELTIKQKIEGLNIKTKQLKEERVALEDYRNQSMKEIQDEKEVVQIELQRAQDLYSEMEEMSKNVIVGNNMPRQIQVQRNTCCLETDSKLSIPQQEESAMKISDLQQQQPYPQTKKRRKKSHTGIPPRYPGTHNKLTESEMSQSGYVSSQQQQNYDEDLDSKLEQLYEKSQREEMASSFHQEKSLLIDDDEMDDQMFESLLEKSEDLLN